MREELEKLWESGSPTKHASTSIVVYVLVQFMGTVCVTTSILRKCDSKKKTAPQLDQRNLLRYEVLLIQENVSKLDSVSFLLPPHVKKEDRKGENERGRS